MLLHFASAAIGILGSGYMSFQLYQYAVKGGLSRCTAAFYLLTLWSFAVLMFYELNFSKPY
jgi:hypothetical protein